MKCPFFMETNVLHCRASAFRKMIVQSAGQDGLGRCSSPGYPQCELYCEQSHDGFAGASCPFLEESAMQYCSAAPVTKFIPYSESVLSRCGNDGYRYCSLYLGMSQPAAIDLESDPPAPKATPTPLSPV